MVFKVSKFMGKIFYGEYVNCNQIKMLQATGDNYSGASLQPLKLASSSTNQKKHINMQMLAKNGVYRHFS